ncbi:MAG TPA: hypothetical protein VKR53_08430 [Puia sp.]|nr:hypothetical protein [Puia sp.]
MKTADFKILDQFDQMQVLEDKAVFLDYRQEGDYSVGLFQLDGFYVEVFFHVIKLAYKKIRVFDDTRFLDQYINQIDITELCDCRH